jgi:hypothetical protein
MPPESLPEFKFPGEMFILEMDLPSTAHPWFGEFKQIVELSVFIPGTGTRCQYPSCVLETDGFDDLNRETIYADCQDVYKRLERQKTLAEAVRLREGTYFLSFLQNSRMNPALQSLREIVEEV